MADLCREAPVVHMEEVKMVGTAEVAAEAMEEGVEVAAAVVEAMEVEDTVLAEAAVDMVEAVVDAAAGVVTSAVRMVILQGSAQRETAVAAVESTEAVEEVGTEEAAVEGLVTTVLKRVISLVSARMPTAKILRST